MKCILISVLCIKLLGESAVSGVLVNVALMKQAKQSSTYWYQGSRLDPSLAVDGVRYLGAGSCTQTWREWRPWWRVDLVEKFHIDKITLYISNNAEISGSSTIQILTSNNDVDFVACHTHTGMFPAGPSDVSCPTFWPKRFIRIEIRSWEALSLCEVEIFAVQDLTSTQSDQLRSQNPFSLDLTTSKSDQLSSPKTFSQELTDSESYQLTSLESFLQALTISQSYHVTTKESFSPELTTSQSYQLTSQKPFSPELTTSQLSELTSEKHISQEVTGSQWYQLTSQDQFSRELTTSQTYQLTSQDQFSPELTTSQTYQPTSQDQFSPELTTSQTYQPTSQDHFSPELTTSQSYQLTSQDQFSPELTTSQTYQLTSQDQFSPELTTSQTYQLTSQDQFSPELTTSQTYQLTYQDQFSPELTTSQTYQLTSQDQFSPELTTSQTYQLTSQDQFSPELTTSQSYQLSSTQESIVKYLLQSSFLTEGTENPDLPTHTIISNNPLTLPVSVLPTNTVSGANVVNTISNVILEPDEQTINTKSSPFDVIFVTKTNIASIVNLLTLTDHLIGSEGSSLSHFNSNLPSNAVLNSKETYFPDNMSLHFNLSSTLSSSVVLGITELPITPTNDEAPRLCRRRCKELTISKQKYKDELLLDKTSLSKYVRTKTSAVNTDPVANLMAWPGIIFLSLLVFFIVLSDLPFLLCGRQRARRRTSKLDPRKDTRTHF